MNYQRPLTRRKAVQFLVLLTILLWATQTLFHQWGFGQEIPLAMADASAPGVLPMRAQGLATLGQPIAASEKFVPAVGRALPGGTLVLRGDATITGSEAKLRHLCRWSDTDAALFESVADLNVVHLTVEAPYKTVAVEDVRRTLSDAGMNVAMIHFAGATACAVNRGDVRVDERAALQQWVDDHNPVAAVAPATSNDPTADQAISPDPQPATVKPALQPAPTLEIDPKPLHALRDLLTADLYTHLAVAPESLQINFNPADDAVLNLVEPYFRFNITPRRVHNLGEISWDVTIVSNGATKKLTVTAMAKAWQTQTVVTKPLAYKQVIRAEDVSEHRALVDHLTDEAPIASSQAVGQQAARELKPGMSLTGRMVDPLPLCRPGELVTITLTQGSVRIKTVARAMEAGSFGQTIRVRNESTRDIFDVTLTGPQEARLGTPPTPSVASTN